MVESSYLWQIYRFAQNNVLYLFAETEQDIKTCIDQLDRCITLLVPKFDELFEEASAKTQASDRNQTKNSKLTPPSVDSPSKRPAEPKGPTSEEGSDEDSDDDDDDDDFVEVPTGDNSVNKEEEDLELRYLGFLNDKSSEFVRNYNIKLDIGLVENEENQVIIEIMRDLNKELKKSHLTKINDWIKVKLIRPPVPCN